MNIDRFEAIIFDLGGVILNLDYTETLRRFQSVVPHLDSTQFYGKKDLLSFYSAYETGKISTETLVAEFNRHHSTEINLADFTHCWNGMIYDFPEDRIHLIKRLRGLGKRVFLLSNINQLHEDAVENSYRKLGLTESFFSLFEKVYYSHRTGRRKPDAETFENMIYENGLTAENTLFIDDSEQHIEGAKRVGITSIHLKNGSEVLQLPIFESLRI